MAAMRINWKFVWVVGWLGFAVADRLFGIVPWLSQLTGAAEAADPAVFHQRLRTGLLVAVCVIALAPFVWPMLRANLFIEDKSTARRRKRAARRRATGAASAPWWRRSWGATVRGARALRFWRRDDDAGS